MKHIVSLSRPALCLALLGIGVSATCSAITVPEIDPASGVNAVALLTGVLLTLRYRRRR